MVHNCVAALEKGLVHQNMAIACELRLVVNQMTNFHSHTLKIWGSGLAMPHARLNWCCCCTARPQ